MNEGTLKYISAVGGSGSLGGIYGDPVEIAFLRGRSVWPVTSNIEDSTA